MILDSLTELSNAQDIHSGSQASSSGYNCGTRVNYDDAWTGAHDGQQNVGQGNPVKAVFNVFNAAAASGAPTLTIELQDASDNVNFNTIESSGALSVSTLTSIGGNYRFEMDLPPSVRQYIQGYYVIGGTGSFSSLQVSMDLVPADGVPSNRVW